MSTASGAARLGPDGTGIRAVEKQGRLTRPKRCLPALPASDRIQIHQHVA
jgi:hypothetical protein